MNSKVLVLFFMVASKLAHAESIDPCDRDQPGHNSWEVTLNAAKTSGQDLLLAMNLVSSKYFSVTDTVRSTQWVDGKLKVNPDILNINFQLITGSLDAVEQKEIKNKILSELSKIPGTILSCDVDAGS